MNFKKTLVLACVLVASILYLTKVAEPRRRAELDKEKLFASLAVAGIDRFEVTPQGAPSYIAVRGAQEEGSLHGWSLSDLPAAKLDNAKVEGVLTSLKSAVFNGPIDDAEAGNDFSVFGLDKPEFTLVVYRSNGGKDEVSFGKKNEYLAARYAKVSGHGGLFLVDEAGFQALKQSRSDVRAKQPINFKVVDVREAVLETSLGRISITQPAVGEWKIMDPAPRDGSKRDIEQLLRDVQGLLVEDFIDGGQLHLAQYGLDKPTTAISVKLRDGLKESLIRVIVGEAPDKSGTYFTYDGAPSVFKIAPEKAIPLKKGLIDLRERRLFKFSGQDIERVVSGGTADAPVDIQAAAMDWTVNGKISDPVFVEQLLNDVANLSAEDFPKEFPSDAFNQPFLTLTITKRKGVGGETSVLTVGKEISGSRGPVRYARVGERGEVSFIRDVEAKRIVPHEGALIQRATPTPAGSKGDKVAR
jgi:Domain of unknown function (DUF4340)